jgi:hypothetical protein
MQEQLVRETQELIAHVLALLGDEPQPLVKEEALSEYGSCV